MAHMKEHFKLVSVVDLFLEGPQTGLQKLDSELGLQEV